MRSHTFNFKKLGLLWLYVPIPTLQPRACSATSPYSIHMRQTILHMLHQPMRANYLICFPQMTGNTSLKYKPIVFVFTPTCTHEYLQAQPLPLKPKPTIATLFRDQRSLGTPPMHSRQPLTSGEKSDLHFLCGQSLALGGANKEAAEEFARVLQYTPNYDMVGSWDVALQHL